MTEAGVEWRQPDPMKQTMCALKARARQAELLNRFKAPKLV